MFSFRKITAESFAMLREAFKEDAFDKMDKRRDIYTLLQRE